MGNVRRASPTFRQSSMIPVRLRVMSCAGDRATINTERMRVCGVDITARRAARGGSGYKAHDRFDSCPNPRAGIRALTNAGTWSSVNQFSFGRVSAGKAPNSGFKSRTDISGMYVSTVERQAERLWLSGSNPDHSHTSETGRVRKTEGGSSDPSAMSEKEQLRNQTRLVSIRSQVGRRQLPHQTYSPAEKDKGSTPEPFRSYMGSNPIRGSSPVTGRLQILKRLDRLSSSEVNSWGDDNSHIKHLDC